MTTPAHGLTRIRVGAWAGVVGPTLFVAVFTVEGWLRPGYDPASTFISALSLGPRGWIRIASFVVTGACFLLFARGLGAQFPDGKASRAGPVLMAVIGVGLLVSGPCVMDPMGTPLPEMSWHGLAHNVLGAVVFSVGPASLFVFFRRFRADPDWHPLAAWTLAAGLVMTTADVVLEDRDAPAACTAERPRALGGGHSARGHREPDGVGGACRNGHAAARPIPLIAERLDIASSHLGHGGSKVKKPRREAHPRARTRSMRRP